MRLSRPVRCRCPNCDYDLSNPAMLTEITPFRERSPCETQAQTQAQAMEPGALDDWAANEYDEGEADCLIVRDSEDKS
jgi:hypothetical protein